MRAKQLKVSGGASTGSLSSSGVVAVGLGIKPGAEIAVAKTVELHFAASDKLQELEIWCLPRIESSMPAALFDDRRTAFARRLLKRLVHRRRSKTIQVAFVAGLTDLRPPMQVGHPFAHFLPREWSRRVVIWTAKHFEITRGVDRRFDAQSVARFVVHFH